MNILKQINFSDRDGGDRDAIDEFDGGATISNCYPAIIPYLPKTALSFRNYVALNNSMTTQQPYFKGYNTRFLDKAYKDEKGVNDANKNPDCGSLPKTASFFLNYLQKDEMQFRERVEKRRIAKAEWLANKRESFIRQAYKDSQKRRKEREGYLNKRKTAGQLCNDSTKKQTIKITNTTVTEITDLTVDDKESP